MDQGAKKFIVWDDVIAECIERVQRGKNWALFSSCFQDWYTHYLVDIEAMLT